MRTLFIIFTGFLLFPALVNGQKKSYQFDGSGISGEVLENYLERAVTMVYLLVPENPEGSRTYPFHADDIRMLKNIGAKFIGRAIYRWGGERLLNDPQFWDSARSIIIVCTLMIPILYSRVACLRSSRKRSTMSVYQNGFSRPLTFLLNSGIFPIRPC